MRVPPTAQTHRTTTHQTSKPAPKAESQRTDYHGTTIEAARDILRRGMAGRRFYITGRKSVARQFAESKSTEQRWRHLFSGKDYSPCVLALRKKKGEVITYCKPQTHSSRIGLSHIDWNQDLLERADKSNNGVFDFLTPRGFSKFDVTVVDPKDIKRIEAANDKEDRQKTLHALRKIL